MVIARGKWSWRNPVSKDLWTQMQPLYSIKPSLRWQFMLPRAVQRPTLQSSSARTSIQLGGNPADSRGLKMSNSEQISGLGP